VVKALITSIFYTSYASSNNKRYSLKPIDLVTLPKIKLLITHIPEILTIIIDGPDLNHFACPLIRQECTYMLNPPSVKLPVNSHDTLP
jgi:hypothetical protein